MFWLKSSLRTELMISLHFLDTPYLFFWLVTLIYGASRLGCRRPGTTLASRVVGSRHLGPVSLEHFINKKLVTNSSIQPALLLNFWSDKVLRSFLQISKILLIIIFLSARTDLLRHHVDQVYSSCLPMTSLVLVSFRWAIPVQSSINIFSS